MREWERVRRVEGGEGKVSLGEGIHLELADLVHHLVDQREGERNVWGVRWGKGERVSRRTSELG